MRFPIGTILAVLFAGYIGHSIWTLAKLFITLKCTGEPCFRSFLASNPPLQLALFASTHPNPVSGEAKQIAVFHKFDPNKEISSDFNIEIPSKVRRNGTFYMHVVLTADAVEINWSKLERDGPTVIRRMDLSEYMVPKAATFNLMGDGDPKVKKQNLLKPKTHLRSKLFVSILSDGSEMSQADIPPELARLIRVNRHMEYLPIIQNDFAKVRLADLVEVTSATENFTLSFNYAPIGIGKLRLLMHVEQAFVFLEQMGFSPKDADDVKGIFSDTNVYLLCGTIAVAGVHILFDFLSFKNEVSFWRKKRTYVGLSMRTTLWRAFSQVIVFLYLLDGNTSMLVLGPAGVATIIELWKCKKILKIEIGTFGVRIKKSEENQKIRKAEELTKAVDKIAMTYLSYLLYPLCACGAVYSLFYQPHKSWYSWTITSMVNGVYAFGFLFMLPQLFINYKLKSVASLPWRAFMYKAFNTFIDDIFAFIITMPTAHRVACFRDDIVFIIYLYQRWLYPVDNSRIDDGIGEFEAEDDKAALLDKKGK